MHCKEATITKQDSIISIEAKLGFRSSDLVFDVTIYTSYDAIEVYYDGDLCQEVSWGLIFKILEKLDIKTLSDYYLWQEMPAFWKSQLENQS